MTAAYLQLHGDSVRKFSSRVHERADDVYDAARALDRYLQEEWAREVQRRDGEIDESVPGVWMGPEEGRPGDPLHHHLTMRVVDGTIVVHAFAKRLEGWTAVRHLKKRKTFGGYPLRVTL